MNINSHKLRRFFQKINIFFIKKINLKGKHKLNDNEFEASIIFRKLLSDSNTELLTSPLSGKFYLKCSKRNILVILSDNQISIINHIYGYNVYVQNFLYERLENLFIEEVEKRRIKMEEEFRRNVQHSLKNIINTFRNVN